LFSPKQVTHFTSPAITAVELTSAITRRQYGGDLSVAQAGALLGHFRRHLINRYRVVELTRVLFDDAMLTRRRHRLRAYDAMQLAVALGRQSAATGFRAWAGDAGFGRS
jgi:predicted nucleic acid-binding protein